MKIEQRHAWIATAFGVAGVTASAVALGRGWTKLGSGALLLSVSVPGYCWFEYFTTPVDQPPQQPLANNALGALQVAMTPWNSGQVKNIAEIYYQQDPIALLDEVPNDKIVWCFENCWDKETLQKANVTLPGFILKYDQINFLVNGIGIDNLKPYLCESFELCMRVVLELAVHGKVIQGVLAQMDGWEDQVTSGHLLELFEMGLLTSKLCATVMERKESNPLNCLRWCRKVCRTTDDLKILEKVIARKWNETGVGVETELHRAKLHACFMGGAEEKITKGDEVFIEYERETFGDIEDFSDQVETACKKAELEI